MVIISLLPLWIDMMFCFWERRLIGMFLKIVGT